VTVRVDTYAFVRPCPYLIERGKAQTITAPIRYGTSGSLVAPASGTIQVVQPDGTDLVAAGTAITVASSMATYDLTAVMLPSTLALGAGYEVRWTLTFGTTVYPTYRQSAYLCEYVPPCVIAVSDLYTRLPELRARIPQWQGDSSRGGDGTGWQPQIDAAYYELLQRLLDNGKTPWLIREVTGYREVLLVRALQMCVQAIPHGLDSDWPSVSKDLYFELQRAEARFRIQYSSDDASERRAGGGPIRLCPVGRPSW